MKLVFNPFTKTFDWVNATTTGSTFDATVPHVNETVTGTQNGSNKVFTTPDTYVAGTLEVYLNGSLQEPGDDYSETTDTTFTFVAAPIVSDVILTAYRSEVLNIQGQDVVYQDRIDDTTNPLYKYYGQSDPGEAQSSAVWRIRRLTYSTGAINFAGGDSNFDKIWDDRIGLTYS